ncbi:MAG: MFS transporter [Propionibacteriales bacterium]|nr:MFS transporter [Propionibacteriales bacterium]
MPREVAVLAAVAFAVAIGFGIVAPAIPVFARHFGVGKTAAGAVVSAFALMRLVSALGGGRLVERFGERVILSTGIFIVAGSTGLSGLAQSYEQLLVLRAVGGIGSSMFTVSAMGLLFRVSGGANRGRAASLFQGGFLVGGLVGPVIGSVLTGISLRLPFFVYAVSLLVAGGIAAVFLAHVRLRNGADPAPAAAAEEPVEESLGVREALRSSAYRAALLANFGTGWALFGVRMSLIPLFVTEAEGMDVDVVWVGIGFFCSSLTQISFLMYAGRYVDDVGRRPAMVRGGLIAGVAMLAVALSTALPVYIGAMLLFGVGSAFLGTAPGAVVGDVMRGRGGRVVAVFQMSSDSGAILGPLLAGALADLFSYGWALALTASVLFAGVVMSARMPETGPAAGIRDRA